MNNKQAEKLAELVEQKNEQALKDFFQQAPSKHCQLLTPQVIDNIFSLHRGHVLCCVSNTLEFDMNYAIQCGIEYGAHGVVKQFVREMDHSRVIFAETVKYVYEMASLEVFVEFISSRAEKPMDLLFHDLASQVQIVKSDKWHEMWNAGNRIVVKDIVKFLNACCVTYKNETLFEAFVNSIRVEYAKKEFAKECFGNAQLQTFVCGLNQIFEEHDELNALCNPNCPPEIVLKVLKQNEYKYTKETLLGMMVSLVEKHPNMKVPGFVIVELPVKNLIPLFLRGENVGYQNLHKKSFVTQVEATGHKWSHQEITSILEACFYVRDREAERTLLHLAFSYNFSDEHILLLVQRDKLLVLKQVKRPIDGNLLVNHATSPDMHFYLHSMASTTKKMTIDTVLSNTRNFETFEKYMELFKLDISQFANANMSVMIDRMGEHETKLFVRKYNFINESCVEKYANYMATCGDRSDALLMFMLVTKYPTFYSMLNVNTVYVSNLLKWMKHNGIFKNVMQVAPLEMLFAPSILEEYYDDYVGLETGTTGYVKLLLNSNDYTMLKTLRDEFHFINFDYLSSSNLRIYMEETCSIDGLHLLVESVNYAAKKEQFAHACPDSNLQVYSQMPHVQISSDILGSAPFEIIFYNQTQLVRCIKRKLGVTIYRTWPMICTWNTAAKSWEYFNEKSPIPATGAALRISVCTSWFLSMPLLFSDIQLCCK